MMRAIRLRFHLRRILDRTHLVSLIHKQKHVLVVPDDESTQVLDIRPKRRMLPHLEITDETVRKVKSGSVVTIDRQGGVEGLGRGRRLRFKTDLLFFGLSRSLTFSL
jgi:DNA-directed RNA polymerase subunit H (RpoH/RPB5)